MATDVPHVMEFYRLNPMYRPAQFDRPVDPEDVESHRRRFEEATREFDAYLAQFLKDYGTLVVGVFQGI